MYLLEGTQMPQGRKDGIIVVEGGRRTAGSHSCQEIRKAARTQRGRVMILMSLLHPLPQDPHFIGLDNRVGETLARRALIAMHS